MRLDLQKKQKGHVNAFFLEQLNHSIVVFCSSKFSTDIFLSTRSAWVNFLEVWINQELGG